MQAIQGMRAEHATDDRESPDGAAHVRARAARSKSTSVEAICNRRPCDRIHRVTRLRPDAPVFERTRKLHPARGFMSYPVKFGLPSTGAGAEDL